MGGNGSHSKWDGGISYGKRTHTDSGFRIDGHKVLLLTGNEGHKNTPMNSNSQCPIYLCATVKKDGSVVIDTIASYSKHKLFETVDIVTDNNGNFVPYQNNGEGSSHSHKWEKNSKGKIGRKSGDRKNHHPIPKIYNGLIEKIINFNKSRKKCR